MPTQELRFGACLKGGKINFKTFFNVFDFGKSNLNTLSQCGIRTPQPGNVCFPESKTKVFSLSCPHASHTYTHTQREEKEEDTREGALSVVSKLNVHYGNKCAQRKKKHTASTLDI